AAGDAAAEVAVKPVERSRVWIDVSCQLDAGGALDAGDIREPRQRTACRRDERSVDLDRDDLGEQPGEDAGAAPPIGAGLDRASQPEAVAQIGSEPLRNDQHSAMLTLPQSDRASSLGPRQCD